ncbi:MAG: hypothetical protein L0H93_08455, partial [Nocardioides sp.]|nr:hypothetical protein [Nocardioides sp.]
TVVPPATAPPVETASETSQGRAAAYLAGNLVDGDHIEVTDGESTYVDYDMTADVVLALHGIGEQTKARDRAAAFLLHPDSVDAYVHGLPYEGGEATYAEPLSKLILITLLQRGTHDTVRSNDAAQTDDPAPADTAEESQEAGVTDEVALDEWIEALESLVAAGTVTDTGTYGTRDASTTQHAWTALALAAAQGEGVDDLLTQLTDAQCADGLFPPHLGGSSCAKGELEVSDIAAQALNAVGETSLVMVPTSTSTTTQTAAVSLSTSRITGVVALRRSLDIAAPDGVVRDANDLVDAVTTAYVATTRLALGSEVSSASHALAGLQLQDGGLGLDPKATESDFALSLRTAPAVAGRTWLQAAESPLRPAPVTAATAATTSANTPADPAWGINPWIAAALMIITALLAWTAGHNPRRQPASPASPIDR